MGTEDDVMGRDQTARFGAFEFDFERMVLRRDGVPVHLQPQPTRVLALLLRDPGRLITREELKRTVWHERVVDLDAGLNFSIRQVREALGDTAASPMYVATVHRRGYRFIAPVTWSGQKQPLWRHPAVAFVAVLVGVIAIGVAAAYDPAPEVTQVAAPLPEPGRTAFAAARWLFEQGELDRALVRVDSVRSLEPDFPEGWALTARIHRGLGHVDEARAAAEQALKLDGEDAEAWYVLGWTHFMDLRGNAALEAFSNAVEADPDEIPYRQWYAQALANELRFDEAIEQLETARQLDPVANIVGVDLAAVYLAAGRYEDAVSFCAASLDLVPDDGRWARDCLLTAHHLRGEGREALGHARARMSLDGASQADTASVLGVTEYFAWDLARIDRLAEAGEALSPFLRVRALARLEDRDGALRGLTELHDTGHFSLQWAPRDPWFAFLHGDPDFEAILTEAGLPVPDGSSG